MNCTLVIGNKNYSSWSMRAWVLLRQAGIAFKEERIPLFEDGYRARILQYSPAGHVPVLIDDNGAVWDSLAISETVAELYPEKNLWPVNPQGRRLARSICAEMHAGFTALRSAMPMNIRAALPGRGRNAEVDADIGRIAAIWETCRARYGSGGDMLFGAFGIADAYYAPVVMRFMTYGVRLPAVAARYADAVGALAAVAEWMAAARQESEIIGAAELYTSA
jgi:glutathione S-transferase